MSSYHQHHACPCRTCARACEHCAQYRMQLAEHGCPKCGSLDLVLDSMAECQSCGASLENGPISEPVGKETA